MYVISKDTQNAACNHEAGNSTVCDDGFWQLIGVEKFGNLPTDVRNGLTKQTDMLMPV